MIGSLTFTRDDGATFTFSAVNPPYQLTPDTQLPAGLTLDVSGGEYTGRNGGYTLAGRLQRRTAKIVYNVRETSSDARSMVQLLNDAAEFFRPMTADLRIVSFTMLVQTDDSNQSAYLMRQGHVTTPFMAPLLRGGHGSYAAEFDLIFDDPLLYWADGSGVVSGDILPAALPGSKIGEVWQEGLQVWAAGLSRWEYPAQGGGGTPQTVHVVSAYQVPVAFTITGQITNPKIVNSRNGSQWSWEGTIPYGRVVSVDVDGVATDWQGNRLLNTMGGLVAAPGDNTFTLTGSDLVLDLKAAWNNITYAWTGTANASASTLSQDGQVVATQWFPNPGGVSTGTNPYMMLDGSISWKWGGRNGFALTKNQSATIGPFARFPLSGLIAGASMQLSLEVDGTGSTGMRGAAVDVSKSDGTLLVESAMYVPDGPLTLNFTVPDDGSIKLNFRGNVNNAVGFYDIMLCSADGWNAMQARGIDWFDGDSGATRISTLSQDGAVVATNLINNPALLDMGNFDMWQATFSVDESGATFSLPSNYPIGHGGMTGQSIAVKGGTTMVVVMNVVSPVTARQNLTVKTNSTEFTIGQYSQGLNIFTWTPASDQIITGFCVYLQTANPTVTVKSIGFYTQSDWQALQARSVDWFDGDSTFNIVSAKASVNIRGAF